jgi:hypothetical protein
MKIIFLATRPKKSIMVTKVIFLQDCFGIFDFWTFFLSIFKIPKILCPKIKKNFTPCVGIFFGSIFAIFITFL